MNARVFQCRHCIVFVIVAFRRGSTPSSLSLVSLLPLRSPLVQLVHFVRSFVLLVPDLCRVSLTSRPFFSSLSLLPGAYPETVGDAGEGFSELGLFLPPHDAPLEFD